MIITQLYQNIILKNPKLVFIALGHLRHRSRADGGRGVHMRHGARHRGAVFVNEGNFSSSIPSIHPLAGSQGGGTAAGRAEHIARGASPRPSV